MKIGVKIGVGFGGMIGLLICVGIWSLQRTIDGYGDEVMTKVYHGRKIAEIPVLIMHAHRYEQDYINTSNNAYAREVNAASQDVAVVVEQVNSQTMELFEMGVELKEMVGRYKL